MKLHLTPLSYMEISREIMALGLRNIYFILVNEKN
jgi:hypothetical protein